MKNMPGTLARALTVLLALLLPSTGPVKAEDAPAPGGPGIAPVTALLDTFLRVPERRTAMVEALIATGDPGLAPFLRNLFQGNVYAFAPADPAGALPETLLAVSGTEVERDGETWAPLFGAYPFAPLAGEGGRTREARISDLLELETDREVRLLIQPVLTAFDLASEDPKKRMEAAALLGGSGDTSRIPLLAKALAAEKDAKVKRLLAEAEGRLEMKSASPERRRAAAAALGKAHAVNALPELKALLVSGAGGAFAEPDAEVRRAVEKSVKRIEAWNSFTAVMQSLFAGLSLGSILILMALGLAIIFGVMDVINMAHGEFMMIGAYTTFMVQNLFQAHLPPAGFGYFLAFSLPLSFLVAGGFGMILEALVIRRLYGRPLETLLATWGISLILVQAARHRFGDLTAVSSPALLSQGWEVVHGVVLPYNRIFILFLTGSTVGLLALLFYRTRFGTRIRAVTQNRSMSAGLGIATRRVDALAFGLGTGMAGLAGCALTQVGNVDPGMGQNYIVDSFLVVVTGGVGKLAGTVLSGLSIGGLNKFLEPFLQSVFAKVVLLGLVILFLQRRPSGLFPARGRNEDT